MPFYDFCAVGDFKTVRVVGERGAVEAVVGVAFDGFFSGGEGLFSAVVSEDQSVILWGLPSDRTCSGTAEIPGRGRE